MIFWTFLILLFCSSTVVGMVVGYINRYLDEMPAIPYLEDYRPSMPSQLFSGDTRHLLIADFFDDRQNREVVPLSVMPKTLKDAAVALEDMRFYEHCGISPSDFLRAAVHDIKTQSLEQGGSTITMQLAEDLIKNHHLQLELPEMGLKSFSQKFWEILLALQIEKRYTKDEILEIYLNQVFLGGNIYGVARAAESYFGKEVSELTLKESALFAGMLQRPNAYSPVKSLEAAEKRTRLVLAVMLKNGYITQEEHDQAEKESLQLNTTAIRRAQKQMFPYFSEEIRRRFIQQDYKAADKTPIEILGQGVDIESTLDVDLQTMAEEVLKRGIVDHEARRRSQGGKYWGVPGFSAANSKSPKTLVVNEEYDARIVKDYDSNTGAVQVTIPNVAGGQGPFTVAVDLVSTWLDDFDLLHAGNFLRVKITQRGNQMTPILAKEDYVQGALVAVQPSTGKVLALVGGFNFYDNEFIRATQTLTVQPGSAYKPFLYAAALSDPSGKWNTGTLLLDEEREYFRGWTPKNFENKIFGWINMRFALSHSLNAASVWLLDNLRDSRTASIQHFRQFCKQNFALPIEESNLTIALGTSGTTPYALAQAYAVFANQGEFVELHPVERIYQRQDNRHKFQKLLYEFKPQRTSHRSFPPQQAYLVTHMLRRVIEEGTGQPAKDLPFFIAGKTGTTDECTYAWFAGFSKDLLCVVYIGYDDFQRSLGVKMTGSKVALPIWIEFMQRAHDVHPEWFGEIPPPEGIVFEKMCTDTGVLASDNCPNVEVFPLLEKTLPEETCPLHGKDALRPYRQNVNQFILSSS